MRASQAPLVLCCICGAFVRLALAARPKGDEIEDHHLYPDPEFPSDHVHHRHETVQHALSAALAETASKEPHPWDMDDQSTEEMMKVMWVFNQPAAIWPTENQEIESASEAMTANVLRTRPSGWASNTPPYVEMADWDALAGILDALVQVEEGFTDKPKLWTELQDKVYAASEVMEEVSLQVNTMIMSVQPQNTAETVCSTAWVTWEGIEDKALQIFGAVEQMQSIMIDIFNAPSKKIPSMAQAASDAAFTEDVYQALFQLHSSGPTDGGYGPKLLPKGIIDKIRRRFMNFPILLFRKLIETAVDHEHSFLIPDPERTDMMELRPVYQLQLEHMAELAMETPAVIGPSAKELEKAGWGCPGTSDKGAPWGLLAASPADWSPEILLADPKELEKVVLGEYDIVYDPNIW